MSPWTHQNKKKWPILLARNEAPDLSGISDNIFSRPRVLLRQIDLLAIFPSRYNSEH